MILVHKRQNTRILLSILLILQFIPVLSASASDQSRPKSFVIGPYKLDDPISNVKGIKEISDKEYKIIGRQFKGERIYKAENINFLGHNWNMMLGVVGGKIYKINPGYEINDKKKSAEIFKKAYDYCVSILGEPSEKQIDIFIWDTSDGNVVLQKGELRGNYAVYLFLTSSAIRNYQRLE